MSKWLALTLAAVSTLALSAQPAGRPHVVVISIDGLMPSAYTQQGPAGIPTLRRLAREGAYAEGVIGVMPTVTYPSHTTLITGVRPSTHGIEMNSVFDPEERANGAWLWYARQIRVVTLPAAVHAVGLRSAAVSWPVSVDTDIDYLVPEYWRSNHPESLFLLRALSRPRDLFDTFELSRGQGLPWPLTDAERTGLAAHVFRTYRPDLLLLHIFETDTAAHTSGPASPEAAAALERADAQVQSVLDAIAETGLASRTDVVIVSDHGFMPTMRQLQPNALFRREGLIEVDERGRITRWRAYFHSAGGSGFVVLDNPEDAALAARVQALVRGLAADAANGIERIWTADDLRKAGAYARASFAIEMRHGFYSGGGTDVLMTDTTSKGGHGYDPERPEMHAALIVAGPDAAPSGSLGIVRMTRIAPTIARWFGITLSPEADEPLALGAVTGTGR
jgi:predicted AlkP superfamily pyrophosphatase or phosphodiesterase